MQYWSLPVISVFLLFPFSYPLTAKDASLWGLLVTSSSYRKSSLTTMSLTLIHMRGSGSSFCGLNHFSHFWLFATLWTVELPDSSVHGIHQASILEWVATPSSRGSSQTRDRTCLSCITGGFFTTEPAEKLFLGAPKTLVVCPMIGFATAVSLPLCLSQLLSSQKGRHCRALPLSTVLFSSIHEIFHEHLLCAKHYYKALGIQWETKRTLLLILWGWHSPEWQMIIKGTIKYNCRLWSVPRKI